jgi:hypothetical protein
VGIPDDLIEDGALAGVELFISDRAGERSQSLGALA